MKRLCIILLALALLPSCGKLRKEIEYVKLATQAIKDTEWMNFEIQQNEYWEGKLKWQNSYFVTCHYNGDSSFYAIDDTMKMETTMVDANRLLVVDRMNNELVLFTPQEKDDNWYSQFKFEEDCELEYVFLYTVPFPNDLRSWLSPNLEQITDTIVRGHSCKKIVAKHHTSYMWNEETEDYDLPVFYRSTTWINGSTNQIDSVEAYNATENGFSKSYKLVLKGINNEDRKQHFDSIFNFDNPLYANYSRHTESFPPFSRLGSHNEDFNDTILSFPIVSLKSDTTSLADAEGWLLLDLWQFGCDGCYEGFEQIMNEKDSLGYRILENNGIRILAANAKSDNFELIEKVAEKFDAADILYSAKGLASKVSLINHAYPSCYLISPEKKVVWSANHCGDYSELLKAKADYERQHQKE